MRHFACLLALFFLVGCDPQSVIQKFSSPEDQDTAKQFIGHLRAREFQSIETAVDAKMQGPTLHDSLVKMADLLPSQEPTTVTLVGARVFRNSDTSTSNLTYEYNFSDTWFLINVATKLTNGTKTIVGFNVVPRSQSLEAENRFTLVGKSPGHFLVLGAAIIAPLLCVYALAVFIRTRRTGRRWPWILFILVGVGKFALNWTTGEWSVSPFVVQLLGGSAFAPLYGPWTISVSVPLGAIIVLLHHWRSPVNRDPVPPPGDDGSASVSPGLPD